MSLALNMLVGSLAGAGGAVFAREAAVRFRPRPDECFAAEGVRAIPAGLTRTDVLALGGLVAGAALAGGLSAPAPIVLVTVFCLTMSAMVDAAWRLVPDIAPAGLALAGVAMSLQAETSAWAAALTGLVVFAALLALHFGHRLLRAEDGLGLGDVKLLAAMAVWFSPTGAALLVALSALGGLALLAVTRRTDPEARGVALAPAAVLAFVVILVGRAVLAA